MKHAIVAIVLACLLVACAAPTPAPTPTSIPTSTPLPTATLAPSSTPTIAPTSTSIPPTKTAKPKPKPTSTRDAESIRAEFIALTAQFVGQVSGVNKVNMVRGNNGALEIEVVSDYLSDDILTAIAYDIAQTLAASYKDLTESDIAALASGTSFALNLNVLETVGTKKAVSSTDFATLKKLADLSITQSEWAALSKLKIEN